MTHQVRQSPSVPTIQAYKLKTAATRVIHKRRSKRLTGSVPDYLELDVDGQAVGMEGSNPETLQALYQDQLVDLMGTLQPVKLANLSRGDMCVGIQCVVRTR